jgi:putative MATE family efflux protein
VTLLTRARSLPNFGETLGHVWRLAWPAIARMLLVTLVFMADRALVGHYDSGALASMQISTTVMWTVCSLFGALGIGTTALVARLVGAGEKDDAAAAARVALLLAFSVGAVVALPILIGNGALLSAVFPRVGGDVIAEASAYLVIVLPILPLAVVEAVASACLHAAGDTRTPLRAAMLANLLNLALSGCLVFGLFGLPALGVRGAAIGSAAAFSLQAVMLTSALWSKHSALSIRFRRVDRRTLTHHWVMFRRLWHVALPTLAEKLAFHGGYLAFVAIIATLGTTAMAANQALISIEAFSYCVAEGFGVAAATLVGQRLGAGRQREAAAACVAAAAMAVACVSGFSLLFVAAPSLLLGVFSNDPTVTLTGVGALHVAAIAQPIMALAVVVTMALRGAGDTRTVLWITLVAAVAVRLGVTHWLAIELDMGLVGVWLGSSADWLVHAVLLAAVLATGRWRRVAV